MTRRPDQPREEEPPIMPQDRSARIEQLEAHERDLVFASFDQADAWRLGRSIVERALAAGHGVTVDVRRPGFVLFHASLPGTTADQGEWIRRKAALALRMEASTALLDERFAAIGLDPTSIGWLDAAEYAVAGGSFPVRVTGVGVVAAVTASGLSSDEDHDLVVTAVAEHLGRPVPPPLPTT